MFLAITESKKIVTGEGDDVQVSFEKHKIFLYKEDFEKFLNGLQQVIDFIEGEQGHPTHSHEKKPAAQADSPAKKEEETPLGGDEIKIDIDF